MPLRSVRRALPLAALLAIAVALPSAAQQRVQRIQVGDLIQRIDRLETEVARLRVAQGAGGADTVRLDQIEAELRRLAGLIERLDSEQRRSLSAMERRIAALEGGDGRAAVPTRPPLVADAAPAYIPSAQVPPQTVVGSGVPVGAPAQVLPTQQFAPAQVEQSTAFAPSLPGPAIVPQAAPVSLGTQSPEALYSEGLRLLNIGSYDQAGAQFEELIAAYPSDPRAGQAQYWLGDMHFKLGRFEQAAQAFLESFRNWPDGEKAPDSLLKLGMTLASIGKMEEACLSFSQVPARYPAASPSLLRRAEIETARNGCGG